MRRFTIFQRYPLLFRKLLGLLIIIGMIFLFYSTNIALSSASSSSPRSSSNTLVNGLEHPYPAPVIAGISHWINSAPLSLNALKGKVILIDFWTYSCINCIRTLPYLKEWYQKYHDQGLVIIGIHSPEFEFEKAVGHVKKAVTTFGIRYPVGMDNQFVTWRHFNNEYWPAYYLINKNGEVVYQHFGEDEYDVTENNIRYLLGIKKTSPMMSREASYLPSQTPETYLGHARRERFANTEVIVKDRVAAYHFPSSVAVDHWALKGKWTIYSDRIVSGQAGASIRLHFAAGKVYAVMGQKRHPVTVSVQLTKGARKATTSLQVTQDQLYTLAALDEPGEGVVELTAKQPGLEIYTFTFGG